MHIFKSLVLPNGQVIPNRLAKAAMEENMANIDQLPEQKLFNLYRAWADSGVGLMITGNVMVDRRAMTGPGGVVLENDQHLLAFQQWAKIARSKGAQV